MLLYWRSRGFVQGMSRAATSEQPSCSPSWMCSLDRRNNKLFLCLCLTMLSLSVVVWVATTPVSTALPLFVRDVEYRPPTRNDRTKLLVPARELGSDYSLPDKLSLPFRRYIKSGEELRSVEWVTTMHEYLLTLNKSVSPHLNMVFGDYTHRKLILNWLFGAIVALDPPLPNVLVFSLDQKLCDVVLSRMSTVLVTCITAPVETIIAFDHKGQWVTALMGRTLALRLINYWGYDVATYDSDAVILKNPQVLYDDRAQFNLIASASIWPPHISREWGFALCAGVLYIKASSATGRLYI